MSVKLFSPIKLRELVFRNRIFVAPMCQYSAVDGVPNNWHLVHLGSRAVGGAALVIAEATAVTDIGRISPADLGIWNDAQTEAFKPITEFIKRQGALAGIQLAHAGRKASTKIPWQGHGKVDAGGWTPVAPSGTPFSATYPIPRELSLPELKQVVDDFVAAAKRAKEAGFQVVEIHMAHGYLLHEFLSPLSNERKDGYGGSLENRLRLPLEVAAAVRAAWPAEWPVIVRISATDWTEGGWDVHQSVTLAKELKTIGIDMIDCSSGGNVERAAIPLGPGYQVSFAAQIKKEAQIATSAVGLITSAKQAEAILENEEADAISMARELLRDPYFPMHAARELGAEHQWPNQYLRAK
jgi:2,4-dienoyl-CoA reductase-like NADH-dependent reductase (Old Yellow Enzyme family)